MHLELGHFEKLIEVVNYISLIILVLGLPGNILMFIVYFKKSLRKLPVSIYFRAMALSNLFITINWLKIFYRYRIGYALVDTSNSLCKIVSFTIYVSNTISVYCLVVAGWHEFLTIVYPTRFKLIRRSRFPLIVVLIICIYNMAFYFVILIDFELIKGHANNSSGNNRTQSLECDSATSQHIYLADLINSSVMPFLVMLTSTIATLVGVVRSRRRLKKYSQSQQRKQHRDIKFGITLVVLNLFFLMTNAPNPLYATLYAYRVILTDLATDSVVWFFLAFINYLFYSIAFYVQLGVNSLVRRDFLDLVKTVWKKSGNILGF